LVGEQLHKILSGHLTGYKQPVPVKSFRFADHMFHVLPVQKLRLRLDLCRQKMGNGSYNDLV